ncbi:Transmembrane GTPase fzo1 [Dissostichus eleginoides]|uniref:Transmembrane GTPase fzo1 n=1 Tax=Dissostichus eleginoides TaxID=100907 RepID=A0AAD9CIR2_DISEL|nr:Transmembrane GTPase fzo1 [Dissostichus eleginoides]
MWVRKWLSEKRRERYGHYSTLLNELKTEDEKAFCNYTRLPRGLYDEVLQRVKGRIEKKDTCNDASIYNGSELKEGLESPNNIFNLPEEKSLPGDDVPVPYYIIGDNAFGINKSSQTQPFQ